MDLILYFMSIMSLTFWVVIWIMHICAITNAKLKLNKKSYTSAASKRKRKLDFIVDENQLNQQHQHQPYVDNNKYPYSLRVVDNIAQDKPQKQRTEASLFKQLQPGQDDTGYNPNCNQANECQNSSTLEQQPPSYDTSDNSLNNLNIQGPKDDHNINDQSRTYTEGVGNNKNKPSNKLLYSYINLPLPGVSILKPLVGIDTNLHANLTTFFQMDYPTYELLFCVQDPDDAAIMIVKRLFEQYPDVDAKLFIGGEKVGVNPKINNMQPAYEAAKYDLILISDSGISMKRDTLLDMVGHMHDDVALVHQMPFVCDGRQGFQSVVEKVYFGTAHARAYLTADLLSINCPTGMSALMRKHLLDEVGGIKAFGQYLAEDFFFAKSFTDRGWKISISSQPAWQNPANSNDTLSTLNSRIQRWVKLRFAMVPQWTLLEPFSECMLLGIVGALSISFIWALDPFAIFLFHVLLWFLSDYKLLCTIQNGPLTFSKTDFIIAWLIRECTALMIFLKALANQDVTWRSRMFKLKWGGYAEEVLTSTEKASLGSDFLPQDDDLRGAALQIDNNNNNNNNNISINSNSNKSSSKDSIIVDSNDCATCRARVSVPAFCTKQAYHNDMAMVSPTLVAAN